MDEEKEQKEQKELDLEDKFKPKEGTVKEKSKNLFNVTSAVNANYKPPVEEPVDLIQDRMKETGKIPGRKDPVFVGEDGRPIFKDTQADPDKKLKLPPMQDAVSLFKIDGFEIPLCGIPQLDAITCIMYVMTRLTQIPANKIPEEIDRILSAFKYQFPDAKGKIIYPVSAPTKAKKTKRRK